MLVGEHGAGTVLDDVELVELGEVERVVLGVLQGKGGQGVVRVLHGLAVLVLRILGEEFLDGRVLPDDGEDFLDGMTSRHGGVVEMPAGDHEEVEAALALYGELLGFGVRAPIAIHPRDEVGLGFVTAELIREFLGDDHLVFSPMVDGALFAEQLAQGLKEAEVGVVVLGIEPFDMPRRSPGVVDDVAAPLEGDLSIRTTSRRRGKGAARAFVIEEEERIVLGLAAEERRRIPYDFGGDERTSGADGHDLAFPSTLELAIAGDVFVLEVGDARRPRGGQFDDAADGARLAVFHSAQMP